MRLFVSEYVCGGAWPAGRLEDSLAREGRLMLTAVLADFARIPGCEVVTTWDARLGAVPLEQVRVFVVAGPREEQRLFQQLAGECDATFVIAPESNRILAERRTLVEAAGGRFLGSAMDAIELCTDKFRLATFLHEHAIPTIETALLSPQLLDRDLDHRSRIRKNSGHFNVIPNSGELDSSFPFVVKPRDGAGSLNMRLVESHGQFGEVLREFREPIAAAQFVRQPFLPGRTVSVAAVVSRDGTHVDLFPVAEQCLSSDGRFHYLGGQVPYSTDAAPAVEQLIHRTCRSLPGLNGYVGFDLILPAENPVQPVLVEINPRLTTSYLGYRALTRENLAERILDPERETIPIVWQSHTVRFLV